MSLIFVYGTLKRGGSNHRFMAGQKFVASTQTVPGFKMYDLSGYPGMVPDAAGTGGIEGEVWEVDEVGLAQLDELEGLQEGLYRRVPIQLIEPLLDRPVQTYLYARDISGRREIGSNWPISL